MTQRIRAEVGVRAADTCRVADSSREADAPITDVRRSATPCGDGAIVEEFTVPTGCPVDDDGVEEVFVSDSHTVYQFERDPGYACVCAFVERFGCPISDLRARDGVLYLSFHAPDTGTIQEIVAKLRDLFAGVHVRHLTRGDDRSETDLAVVDRSRMTDKQREAITTAHVMGYFEHPRRANVVDVADALDIAPATFTEHLAAAQRKILDMLLET